MKSCEIIQKKVIQLQRHEQCTNSRQMDRHTHRYKMDSNTLGKQYTAYIFECGHNIFECGHSVLFRINNNYWIICICAYKLGKSIAIDNYNYQSSISAPHMQSMTTGLTLGSRPVASFWKTSQYLQLTERTNKMKVP